MGRAERLAMLADPGSFVEWDKDVTASISSGSSAPRPIRKNWNPIAARPAKWMP
jgi:hypothetical protein